MDWNKCCVDPRKLPIVLRQRLVVITHPFKMSYSELTGDEVEEAYKTLGILTPRQVLHMWLTYEGIIGYTEVFIRIFDTLMGAAGVIDSAERWDTLFNISRIRTLGWARGGPQGTEGAIRHIGFDFTSDQEPHSKEEKQDGQNKLLEFVDGIREYNTNKT